MVKESVVITGIDMNVCVTSIQVTSSGNYESGAPSPGERLAPQERNEMNKRYDINEDWTVYEITWLVNEEECPCFLGGSCPTDGKHKVVGPLHYKHERNENE